MSEHTPGPWKRNSFTGVNGAGYSISEVYADQPDGVPVSVARVAHTTTPEGAANWRLIVAAPDLLDALKSARGYVQDCARVTGRNQDLAREALGQIDAVIARAEEGAE